MGKIVGNVSGHFLNYVVIENDEYRFSQSVKSVDLSLLSGGFTQIWSRNFF